jgi:hypothetical protein
VYDRIWTSAELATENWYVSRITLGVTFEGDGTRSKRYNDEIYLSLADMSLPLGLLKPDGHDKNY